MLYHQKNKISLSTDIELYKAAPHGRDNYCLAQNKLALLKPLPYWKDPLLRVSATHNKRSSSARSANMPKIGTNLTNALHFKDYLFNDNDNCKPKMSFYYYWFIYVLYDVYVCPIRPSSIKFRFYYGIFKLMLYEIATNSRWCNCLKGVTMSCLLELI